MFRSSCGWPRRRWPRAIFSDAEQNFQAALSKDPNNLDAARGVASVANQLGDYNLLMQVATSTLARNPESSDAYLWKGIAEIHQQQPDQAAADLQTAINKSPNNAAAMQELGALRLSQGKLPEGKQAAGSRRSPPIRMMPARCACWSRTICTRSSCRRPSRSFSSRSRSLRRTAQCTTSSPSCSLAPRTVLKLWPRLRRRCS